MDKDKIYWIWQHGNQVMVYYCHYSDKWCAVVNSHGRAVS